MADRLIDGFIGDGEVELFERFAVPLPAQLFMTLFGAPLSDLEFFITKKDEILANSGTTREEREVLGRLAGADMRARLLELLLEKRAAGATGDDLISQFLTWEVDGERLSDNDILNVMQLFVIAGLDTVTSSISCLIAWLAQHPEERRRVMDNPSLIPAVVEELMRYESPVPSSGVRYAIDDFDVNGVGVRKGDMIYLCWATANLDPAVFDDPLTVNFDRQSNRHIAFAAGRHRCLGSHLARLEIRLALEQFHRRVSDYWITEGEEVGYKFEGVRHASHLPVSFTAR
jgi:cytochrome P450